MYLFSLLLPLTTLFLLARADPPFPIITKPYPPAVSTKVASDVSVYLTSAAAQPAYTSVLIAFASEAPELASSLVSGPLVLGVMFFTATATPTWYPQLPSDVQSYVSSVAAAQASILAKDSGAASSRREVWVGGVVITVGGLVVMLL